MTAAPPVAGPVRAYRADVDGLRAVAIALVVAFHFGVPGVAGGYIGVDLFFVISGFLIASIFERGEIRSIGSIAAFYGRRIKRLMPAFLVVAAVTIAVGTELLLPDDYDALLKSVRESLSFTGNRFFARETTDYFAGDAAQMPWLHTWSLSIEWQFYFAFPLVFVAVESLPGARARRLAWATLVVAGVALSIALVARAAPDAYFSAPARFFEFLLGASATRVPRSAVAQSAARWFPWAGVALLIVLAIAFDATTPFPGIDALGVCLIGFGLIVVGWEGSPLSHPVFAWIGKRSYSIYLWHWPLVAYSAYLQRDPSVPERLAWLAGILLVADLTYRWVERPGLRSTWRPLPTAAIFCVLPFAIVAAFTLVARHFDGIPSRLGAEAAHAYTNIKRFEGRRVFRCHDAPNADFESCAFGDLGATTRALMIGDSHARHYRPFVEVLATHAHIKVYALTNSLCATLEGSALRVATAWSAACEVATARDFALIRSGRFRFVILAERWIGYPPDALSGLDASIAVIVAAGAVPMIILPIAEDGTNTKDCFYRHVKTRRPFVEGCAIRADNAFAGDNKPFVATLLRDLAHKYPTLILVDPQAVQCERGVCRTFIDGTPIYTDLHHINAFGATMLGRDYLNGVGDPFDKR